MKETISGFFRGSDSTGEFNFSYAEAHSYAKTQLKKIADSGSGTSEKDSSEVKNIENLKKDFITSIKLFFNQEFDLFKMELLNAKTKNPKEEVSSGKTVQSQRDSNNILLKNFEEFKKYAFKELSSYLNNPDFPKKVLHAEAITTAIINVAVILNAARMYLNIPDPSPEDQEKFIKIIASFETSQVLPKTIEKPSQTKIRNESGPRNETVNNTYSHYLKEITGYYTTLEKKVYSLAYSFLNFFGFTSIAWRFRFQKKSGLFYSRIFKGVANFEVDRLKRGRRNSIFRTSTPTQNKKSREIASEPSIEKSEFIELLNKIDNSLGKLEKLEKLESNSNSDVSVYKNTGPAPNPLKNKESGNISERLNKIELLRKYLKKFTISKKAYDELYVAVLRVYKELNELIRKIPNKDIKRKDIRLSLNRLKWALKDEIETIPKTLWVDDQLLPVKKFMEKIRPDGEFYGYMKVIKEFKKAGLSPEEKIKLKKIKQNNKWNSILSDFKIRFIGGVAAWVFEFNYSNKTSAKDKVFILKVNRGTGRAFTAFDDLLQYYPEGVNEKFLDKRKNYFEIMPKIYGTMSMHNSEIPFSIILSESLPSNLFEEAERLHSPEKSNSPGYDRQKILQAALKRFKHLLEIYIKLDEANLHFTDGKLANYYLNNNDDIVLADSKSLLVKGTKFDPGNIIYTQGCVFSKPGRHSNCSQIQKDTIFTALVSYLTNISTFELKESRPPYSLYLFEKADQLSNNLIEKFEKKRLGKKYIKILKKIKLNIKNKTKQLIKIENVGGCLGYFMSLSDRLNNSKVLKSVKDIMLNRTKEDRFGDHLVLEILRKIQRDAGNDGILKIKKYFAQKQGPNILIKGEKIEDFSKKMTIEQKFKFIALIITPNALRDLGLNDEAKNFFMEKINDYIECWNESISQFEGSVMKNGNLDLEDRDKFILQALKNSRYSSGFESAPNIQDLFSEIEIDNEDMRAAVAELKIEFERMLKSGGQDYDSDMRKDFVLFCEKLDTFSNGTAKEFFNLLCKLCPEGSLPNQSPSISPENKSNQGNLTEILSEVSALMEKSNKEVNFLSSGTEGTPAQKLF